MIGPRFCADKPWKDDKNGHSQALLEGARPENVQYFKQKQAQA